MTRREFLADPDVQAMLSWLADRLLPEDVWEHAYLDRRSGVRWQCDNLHSAFRQYRWAGADWNETACRLARFRYELRAAVACENASKALEVSKSVLSWGGVSPRNASHAERLGDGLLDELRHVSALLEAESTPQPRALKRHDGNSLVMCRMNAGFVKIYSVLLDYCVIYDGRVGAALGLLVRQFCEATSRRTVPSSLAFAWGAPKEGLHAPEKKRRDPSQHPYVFPQLVAGNPHRHVDNIMRANWLLRAALDHERGAFSKGQEGFHEVAAALFMIGYDLGPNAARTV